MTHDRLYDIDMLQRHLAGTSLTVEKIRNDVSRQTRFVVFDAAGEKLLEARYEVAAAWVAGYSYAKRN